MVVPDVPVAIEDLASRGECWTGRRHSRHYNPVSRSHTLLAGDIGGTKTLLGLFATTGGRPERVTVRIYPTAQYDSFHAIVDAFFAEVGRPDAIAAAAAGVAGPVAGRRATLTNVGWSVSEEEIATHCATPRVRLLNDLEATATSVEVLRGDELESLHAGSRDQNGNAAVISVGTGLGAALLHRVNGRLYPLSTEAGHADFAARTDRELELVRMLRDRFGRAEVEQVLSGRGIVNLHALTHAGRACPAVKDPGAPDAAALISRAALERTCTDCLEALHLFVAAFGAETGNLALRALPRAGVFIGGGIAPKILPLLQAGPFMQAFLDKAPMDGLVARIPVAVILNPEAGLLGAAVAARDLAEA
jgi:glucokinase